MTQKGKASSPPNGGEHQSDLDELGPDETRVIELREEQLVPHKELRELGEVTVRTEVETVPAELEVDAFREEVEVEHEPVGRTVTEREHPTENDGEIVVPIYEEQLVVSKRLVLRERLHIRRVGTSERRLVQDTVHRERLIIEDPLRPGLVHEVYPTQEEPTADGRREAQSEGAPRGDGDAGFLTNLVSKALE